LINVPLDTIWVIPGTYFPVITLASLNVQVKELFTRECVRFTVHNCRTQHSAEEFSSSSFLTSRQTSLERRGDTHNMVPSLPPYERDGRDLVYWRGHTHEEWVIPETPFYI